MPIIESPAEEVSSDTAELIADLDLLPKHFTETGVIERLVAQLTEKDLALTAAMVTLAARDNAKPKLEAVLAERQRQIAKGFDATHDDARGADHLITWAIDYAARGETVKAAAVLLALNEHRGRVKPMAERLTMNDTLALIARASVEYTKWHDSDPVMGEEDSISHEYVREIVPELIEALIRVQAALEQVNLDVAVRAAKIAAGLDPEEKYQPMKYIDHLPAELHELFWAKQVGRVLGLHSSAR